MSNQKKIYVKFEGKDISDKAIPIDYLGRFLRAFQEFFLKTTHVNNPGVKKDWVRLVLTDISSGSATTEIQLKNPDMIFESTYEKSTNTSREILNLVQQEKIEEAHENFLRIVSKTPDRIGICRSLKSVWSTKKITTSIGTGDSKESAEFITLDQKYKKRIHKWLKKEFFKGVLSMKGFLTRIKADEPASFTVLDEYGDYIKVYFDLEEELDTVKEFLTKPIIIKGLIETVGNQKTIKKMITLKELIFESENLKYFLNFYPN